MACSVWPQIPWLEQREGSTEHSRQSSTGDDVLVISVSRGCEGGGAFWVHGSVFPCLEVRGASDKGLRLLQP